MARNFTSEKEFKAALVEAGVKQKDIIAHINSQGIKCSPSALSLALSCISTEPKHVELRIIAAEYLNNALNKALNEA